MSERCSQVAVEVLRAGGTTVERATQVAVEVFRTGGTTVARATQVAVEVLRENADEATGTGTVVVVCT